MTDAELEAQLLAQAQGKMSASSGTKLLIDLMHDKFGADDLVKIKNFMNDKFGWTYCDKKTTRIEQPNEFTRRVWQGDIKARVLAPGKTIIIPGWEAYAALNRMFDEWLNKNYADKLQAYYSSQTIQEEFLSKSYLGIYDVNEANETPVDVKKEVEDDLGLSDGKATKESAATSKK